MFRVYWTNHFYFSSETFDSVEAALVYVKDKYFEAQVYNGADELVATWSVFGGTRYY